MGSNLDQEFRILGDVPISTRTAMTFRRAAKEHLEQAGIRRVTIERVYLCPEHITPGIIERFAVPYEVEKGKPSSDEGRVYALQQVWRARRVGSTSDAARATGPVRPEWHGLSASHSSRMAREDTSSIAWSLITSVKTCLLSS